MPSFKYLALDQKGQAVRAKVFAGSVHEVAQSLQAQGLNVINVEEESVTLKSIEIGRGGKISLQDKITLTRHLSVMIQAGLPLVAAIDVLQKDLPNKKLKSILTEARAQLEAGKTLAETFARYPQDFDETFISILHSGEVSGKLSEVLESLSKKLEQDQEMRSKIVSALIYPAVVIFGLFLVGMVMVVFVVPKVTGVFEKMDMKLPITLRLMAFISKLVTFNYFLTAFVLIFLLVGGFFGLRAFWRTRLRTRLTERLPVVSKITQLIDLTNLTSTLSLLLESGVPIVKAIRISAKAVINPKLRVVLLDTEKGVRAGKSLGDGLRGASRDIIPPLLIQIVEVGERTGQLHAVLRRISGFYAQEVALRLKNLASLIEPILMLVIGIGIGVVVVSIIAPIYKLVGQVGQ